MIAEDLEREAIFRHFDGMLMLDFLLGYLNKLRIARKPEVRPTMINNERPSGSQRTLVPVSYLIERACHFICSSGSVQRGAGLTESTAAVATLASTYLFEDIADSTLLPPHPFFDSSSTFLTCID